MKRKHKLGDKWIVNSKSYCNRLIMYKLQFVKR